ncbi:hypothetical protein MBCUT_20620 [Methanobrevibacter cuticularis]|uniref:Transposase DDE domain-containing protein n=1 Tax=Methanobrevibacter cuticularis TaxID=47311 RepID=A0A166CGR3_9EURY|nr:hypothetical protein [Methanobrevibacter cuticularis]KZX14490.1 hypothetical protein MBCUT_20620 [Methanobrevibacter cuticularis]
MGSKNIQKKIKNSRMAIWQYKKNLKLNEFNTTGIKRTQTEAKLIGISHNLKRIYKEINKNN